MPKLSDPAKQLEETIARLQARRSSLMNELVRIETLFTRYGIVSAKRGRRSAAFQALTAGEPKRGRRRKRGHFAKSAQVSIVDFLKSKGARGAITADINRHWKSEGRAGSAYVTLGQLCKLKKVKKENLKGQRGSRYTAA